MSKWTIELSQIYTPFLNWLSQELGRENKEFDIRCIEDDMGFYYHFESSLLDEAVEAEQAYLQALQLARLINGLVFLVYEKPIGYLNPRDLYAQGGKVYFKKPAESKVFNCIAYLTSTQRLTGQPLNDLLQIAKVDAELRDLLFLLGGGHDFATLYLAYEAISTEATEIKMLKSLVGPELAAKLKQFTATANNFNAIGADSRHRNLSYPLPKNLMSLEDAVKLLREVSLLVIESAYGITLPIVPEVRVEVADLFDDFKNQQ